MEFIIHKSTNTNIAELKSGFIINDVEDMVDLLGNASYHGAQKIILKSDQLHENFFILKTGIAGEMLQKISNYRMQLAIIGDFENIQSKSLHDFVLESNKRGQICFVGSLEEALIK